MAAFEFAPSQRALTNVRWRAAVFIAAVAAYAAGTLAYAPAARASSPAAGAAACTQKQHTALESGMRSAYDRIASAPDFTGIGLFSSCGPVDVFLASSAPYTRTLAMGDLPATMFRFHTVAHSLSTLMGVQAAITTDFAALHASGLALYRYWPDMTTGLERIELSNATTAQLASLVARYGSAYVQPVSITNPPVITTTANDANDAPAFSAGDFIVQLNAQNLVVVYCTGAFGVHTGTGLTERHFMLTAGHCSTDGNNNPVTNTTWNNADDSDSNGTPNGGLLPVGVVTNNVLGSSTHVDGAYITTQTSTEEWQGWYTSGFQNAQFAATRALVGNTVCTDGAYEGQTCTGVVQSTSYLGCVSVSGFPVPFCDEIQALNSSGSVITGEGDSGGPAFGLGPENVSFGVNSLEAIQNKACPHFTWRGNVCSSVAYFADLPTILSVGGGAVNTASNP